MIDELKPQNDNMRVPPYRVSWIECFIATACIAIVGYIMYQGITSLAMVLAGL